MKKSISILFYAVILLILCSLLIGVTYSWLLINNPIHSDDVDITLGSKNTDIALRIKVNDGEFQEVATVNDFETIFNLAVPSNQYEFEITLTNIGNMNVYNNLVMNNVHNVYVGDQYYDIINQDNEEEQRVLKTDNPSLLDWFYFKDSNIKIKTYEDKDIDSYTIEETTLLNNSLSDIIDEKGDYSFFDSKLNVVDGKIVVSFILVYNELSTLQDINILIDSFSIVYE